MRDRNQKDDTDDSGGNAGSGETVVFDRYDWQGEDTPSIAVAEAVAAVTNRSVTAIPPLQTVVDADALDVIAQSSGPTRVEVSFSYAGTEVTVLGDGRIELAIGSP
ncbi:HalOD1 output domain-containing protein [Halosimplex sp. J119]